MRGKDNGYVIDYSTPSTCPSPASGRGGPTLGVLAAPLRHPPYMGARGHFGLLLGDAPMIRIPCPFCGVRDHSEFTYGQDASFDYPKLDASLEEWVTAVFERENIDGVVRESWHHSHGCRMWLVVERDTTNHAIHSVRSAHPGWAQVLEPAQSAPERP